MAAAVYVKTAFDGTNATDSGFNTCFLLLKISFAGDAFYDTSMALSFSSTYSFVFTSSRILTVGTNGCTLATDKAGLSLGVDSAVESPLLDYDYSVCLIGAFC